MWKDFQEEQFDRKTIETHEGFITYNIYQDESAYIHILYVKPEFRSAGIGKKLEDMIIEKHKPNCLYCYVDLQSKNPEVSLQAIIGVGYKIKSASSEKVVLSKDIDYATIK